VRQLWKVFDGGFDAAVFEIEKWKPALCPEGGNGGGDFLSKISVNSFYESSLYKYMRIYL
jgi:hypothetical protein